MVNRSSEEKLYAQIVRLLSADIESQFEAQDKYYSEIALSERYAVNRHTIRRSVDILVQQGLLERRAGSGLHVAEKRTSYPIEHGLRLTDAFAKLGLTLKAKVLSLAKVRPAQSIADDFSLSARQTLVRLQTLRYLNDPYTPIALIDHYFSPQVSLRSMQAYDATTSLGQYIQQQYSVRLVRQLSSMSVVGLPSEASHLLDVPLATYGMKLKTKTLDANTGDLCEYSVTLFPSDMIQLEFSPTNFTSTGV